jgi:hypothetical protein
METIINATILESSSVDGYRIFVCVYGFGAATTTAATPATARSDCCKGNDAADYNFEQTDGM